MEWLNTTADQLNARIRERAVAAGFGFVNPTKAYLGHAVRADVEWVNGLSKPVREQYHHPNVRGQRGYRGWSTTGWPGHRQPRGVQRRSPCTDDPVATPSPPAARAGSRTSGSARRPSAACRCRPASRSR